MTEQQASLLGAGISAIGNLGGAAVGGGISDRAVEQTNATNLMIAEKNNQWNWANLRAQNEWNMQRWKEEQKYNEPAQQIARLRAAGLSVAAAAQSLDGAGNTQAIQSADYKPAETPQLTPATHMGEALQKFASGIDFIGLMRGIESLKQDRINTAQLKLNYDMSEPFLLTRNDAQKWSLYKTMQDYDHTSKLFPYKLKSLDYEQQTKRYEVFNAKWASRVQKMTFRQMKLDFGFLQQKYPKEIEALGEKIKNIVEEGNKIRQEINESKSRASLNVVTQQNVHQDTENKKKLGEGFSLENHIKEINAALADFGFPSDPAQKTASLIASGKLDVDKLPQFWEAAKSYIQSGGNIFNGGNNGERQYFNYIINPGQGQANSTPVWSHGSLFQSSDLTNRFFEGFFDDLSGALKYTQPWKKPKK